MPILGQDKPKLDQIERRYSSSDIITWRWIARNELKAEKKTEEEQHPKQQQAQGGGWLGWVWGGGAKKGGEQDPDQLDSDEVADRFGVRGEEVTADIDLPEDVIKVCVNAKLETGSLALREGGDGTDIIRMVFDAFSADLLQRKENLEAAMGLGGMRVYDATVKGTQYSQVVRVKEDSRGPSRSASVGTGYQKQEAIEGVKEESDPDNPFFYAKFESKPLDRRADSAVTLKMRPMEIVYHRGYIEKVVKFFRPPADKLETVGALMESAGGALVDNFRQTTRIGLEWALEQHSSVDIRADLAAPIIIIPEDVTRLNSQHLMLDAGHISVSSDLIPQEERAKTRDKKQLTDDDLHYLESIMYDKMRVDLKDAQLIMGTSLDECLEALDSEKPDSNVHLLDRISMHFDVSRCIVPMAPNLTQLKIAGDLPELHVNFSDRKYRTIMLMKDVAIPNFDDDEPVPVEDGTDKSAGGAPLKKSTTPARPSMSRPRRKSVFSRPSGFLKDIPDDEYAIDLDDGTESTASDTEKKGGEDDEFFEAPDVAEASSLFRRKDLEFTFNVGKLMASVYKSSVTEGEPDRHLVDPTLEGFVFSFEKRQYDMTVGINLRTLYLDDKMVQQGTAFSKLITSEALDAKEDETTELVKFKYVSVQRESPEFQPVHEGVSQVRVKHAYPCRLQLIKSLSQTVEVDMSTLNVFVTRPSIVSLRILRRQNVP